MFSLNGLRAQIQVKVVCLAILYLLFINQSAGQVTPVYVHHSGFYKTDSALFHIPGVLPPGVTALVAVNCFTECFVPYTGAVMLYNRNHAPNTWENQQFTKAPFSSDFAIDTLAVRGQLNKVNVVRVRIINAAQNIVDEKTYFIGLSGYDTSVWLSLPIVHLFVDSNDAFGPHGFYGPGEGLQLPAAGQFANAEFVWNYDIDWDHLRFRTLVPRERIEKPAYIEIINPFNNHVLLSKKVGVRLSGASSLHLYNKSLQVVARNVYSGGSMSTSLFGSAQKLKWLRFRAGGAAQQTGFGNNEIALQIIHGLKLGESKIKPVVVYLNGSYWTLAFAQEKPNRYLSQTYHGTPIDDIHMFDPTDLVPINEGEFGNPVFVQNYDTSRFLLATAPPGAMGSKKFIVGVLDAGKKEKLLPAIQTLINLYAKSHTHTHQYQIIDSVLDIHSCLRYLAVTDYLQSHDYLDNNIVFALHGNNKLHVLAKDFDDIWGHTTNPLLGYNPGVNHWIGTQDTLKHRLTFSVYVLRDLLLNNPICVKELLRVYQDLLNTTFQPNVTLRALNRVYSPDFFFELERHIHSWGGHPNGGFFSVMEYGVLKDNIRSYLLHRPDSAWQIIATHWMPEFNYSLDARKRVHLIMDSVPQGFLQVKLNSLLIDSSWNGLYYPNPSIVADIVVDSSLLMNQIVMWKEYPDSSTRIELHAQTDIYLTPVLRPKPPKTDTIEINRDVVVYPNPANSEIWINRDLKYYRITDLSGRKVSEGTTMPINISYLLKGDYSIEVHTVKEEVVRTMFVKK